MQLSSNRAFSAKVNLDDVELTFCGTKHHFAAAAPMSALTAADSGHHCNSISRSWPQSQAAQGFDVPI